MLGHGDTPFPSKNQGLQATISPREEEGKVYKLRKLENSTQLGFDILTWKEFSKEGIGEHKVKEPN